MKNYIILLLSIMISCLYNGQIGIGTTTPNPSAILDINVNSITPKKGFLFPRVNLTNNMDASTIPSPAVGLMAYNKTVSGSGNSLIKANSLVIWNSSSWQTISNLPEIQSLKVPLEYLLLSKNQQDFSTTGELAIVNSSTPVTVTWQSGDVYLPNPTDIQLTGNSIKFLTDSYYQFSGMVTCRVNVSTLGDPSHLTLVLQSSINNGSTWNNIFANSLPFEKFATGKSQTIALPNFMHHFAINELLRIIIYKPSSANNYAANSGIIVNAPGSDITKSIRIVRIQQ